MKAILLLLAASAAAAPPPASPRIFSGVISDSECGLSHEVMRKQHHIGSDLACTRRCVEKFKQEYVLADHTTGDVFQLDDQKGVARYAARLVRILGTLDESSGSIHVLRVEPIR